MPQGGFDYPEEQLESARDNHTEGCDHSVTERATAHEAYQAAIRDMHLFGSGFVRTHPDGRVEHVPIDEMVMHVRPNTQEAEGPNHGA